MIGKLEKYVMQKINGKREFIPGPRVLQPGELEDVIAIRDSDLGLSRCTNIAWVLGEWHANAGFEWGYCGQGPWDFSTNILMHFTEHDIDFSRNHCREFLEKFVSKLPRPGGRIKKEDILAFIAEKRANDKRK